MIRACGGEGVGQFGEVRCEERSSKGKVYDAGAPNE